jgi:hypothetical protein
MGLPQATNIGSVPLAGGPDYRRAIAGEWDTDSSALALFSTQQSSPIPRGPREHHNSDR